MRLNINVSVTEIGVQIVRPNPEFLDQKYGSYKEGDSLWDFLSELANKEFSGIKQIEGMKLVQVDVGTRETQFSYMPQSVEEYVKSKWIEKTVEKLNEIVEDELVNGRET